MDNCQPPLSFAFFEAAQSPLCPHFLPEGQLGYEKSQRASSPLGHPGGRFRMQEEELEMKEKEERGKDRMGEEGENFLSVHFLLFTLGTWGSFLPWKEILLLYTVGSKDDLSVSRLTAHRLPHHPSGSSGRVDSAVTEFGNQITLALNASLPTYTAL